MLDLNAHPDVFHLGIVQLVRYTMFRLGIDIKGKVASFLELWVSVCLILLTENPFGKVCIKSRILRRNLKAKLLRQETKSS